VWRKARKLGIHSGKSLVGPVNSPVDSLWTERQIWGRRPTGVTLDVEMVTRQIRHGTIVRTGV
jgi:hypothetical protein